MATDKKKQAGAGPAAGAAPRKDQAVRIVNRNAKDGYRRAGVPHPRGSVDHAFDAFDEEQLAALKADPMLEVEIVDAIEK